MGLNPSEFALGLRGSSGGRTRSRLGKGSVEGMEKYARLTLYKGCGGMAIQ